jgi:dimethylhistidine N-methyltransferase
MQDGEPEPGTAVAPSIDEEPNLAEFGFAEAVRHGLSLRPRRIASKWLYDAAGSRLFEAICDSEGYYVPRAEAAILRAKGAPIARALGRGVGLVELGSGSSTKVRLLLDALEAPRCYVPIEISQEQLAQAAERLRDDYPDLPILPLALDYMKPFELPPLARQGRIAAFFPGSTLCNLLPHNSAAFLRRMAGILGPGSLFLAGVDLKKDEATLLRAYNEVDGPIWHFNLNILDRMNRELGADFDRTAFRHEALYNRAAGRIEAALPQVRGRGVPGPGAQRRLDAGRGLGRRPAAVLGPPAGEPAGSARRRRPSAVRIDVVDVETRVRTTGFRPAPLVLGDPDQTDGLRRLAVGQGQKQATADRQALRRAIDRAGHVDRATAVDQRLPALGEKARVRGGHEVWKGEAAERIDAEGLLDARAREAIAPERRGRHTVDQVDSVERPGYVQGIDVAAVRQATGRPLRLPVAQQASQQRLRDEFEAPRRPVARRVFRSVGRSCDPRGPDARAACRVATRRAGEGLVCFIQAVVSLEHERLRCRLGLFL